MTRLLFCLLAVVALAAVPSTSIAGPLLDQTDLSDQTNGPTSLVFTAGGAATTISFAGYDIPGFIHVTGIELTTNGGSTNLLGTSWTLTPAAMACTFASQGAGAFGTNSLNFGSGCVGDYDIFSQTISTQAGADYTLDFLLSVDGSPNGLRVSADSQGTAVPEPASWAMLLLGFGGMGLAIRRGRSNARRHLKFSPRTPAARRRGHARLNPQPAR